VGSNDGWRCLRQGSALPVTLCDGGVGVGEEWGAAGVRDDHRLITG